MAHRVIHSLRQRLAAGCVPLFTSDGLNLYFYAALGPLRPVARDGSSRAQVASVAGGAWSDPRSGQEMLPTRRLVRVSQVIRLGAAEALQTTLQELGFSGRLNTAFIERVNLTIRHALAALARRTWATAQQFPALLAHLEWWRAYYHFVRPHAWLRVSLAQPPAEGGKRLTQRHRQRTPARAVGRTHRRWTAREALSCPFPKVWA